MATASEVITAALREKLGQPRPRFSGDDLLHGWLGNSKLPCNSLLRHGPREVADSFDLAGRQFRSPVVLSTTVCTVRDLIAMVFCARCPSQVGWIAAKAVAATMGNFCFGKRLLAVRFYADNAVSQHVSRNSCPKFDLAIASSIGPVGPRQTVIAGDRQSNLSDKLLRFPVASAPSERIAVVLPSRIVALAKSLCRMFVVAPLHRTCVGGGHGYC